ncbi:MAG: GIY-YIG nuclease family protein [Chitinivibrionia bacterium]|nr:GIY-YIG nuclease family protein [Chitinivibrionia bacterium]
MQKKLVYAFVANGCVKYVGTTVKALKKRMREYRNYNAIQTTNRVNNARIVDELLLENGSDVSIYAISSDDIKRNIEKTNLYINFAAGLEDELIKVLKPEWNNKGKKETK